MPIRCFFHILFYIFLLVSCGSCQLYRSVSHPEDVPITSDVTSRIQWAPWQEETFQAAQEQDRLILLDLTAVWCHACHVMDETTYTDPSIIALLNTRFIPIRVDTDQRPDIDARYRHGGWPTTSILLPTGEIVFQGNYLEPEDLQQALQESEKLYRENKEDLLSQAATIWKTVTDARKARSRPQAAIDPELVGQMGEMIEQHFDPVNGGFQDAPKFFEPDAITFLLARYHHLHDETFKRMALLTLQQQRKLSDPVWGGFYRYAEQADWTNPHFEKMLHIQAVNLQNYLEAYQVTGDLTYREVLEGIIRYVTRVLMDSQGRGFFASQDADVKDTSGSRRLLMSGEDYFQLEDDARRHIGMPGVDRTIYTDWNGAMFRSLLKVHQVLPSLNLASLALPMLNHVFQERYEAGKGMAHRTVNGEPQAFGLLRDQVWFAQALIEAFFTTGEARYIDKAEQLTKDVMNLLEDRQGGGLYDRPQDISAEGLLKFPHKSLRENLRAVMLLCDLYYVTEHVSYRKAAERTLQYVLQASDQLPLGLSGMAIERFVRYPVNIVVVGSKDDDTTSRLFQEGLKLYAPGKIVRWLDPAVDSLQIGEVTFPNTTEPTAYICANTICSQPFHRATEFPSRYQDVLNLTQ
ncbi:MAG: thioredoxin domain-containing protein [Nitrospirales bacterium]|nr:MAG: thioredoxin domain-containing protein [Nitrospirales bacterium]